MPNSAMTGHKIQFSDPVPHVLESVGKTYYMQDATNNGQQIMICSDWFRSDGIKIGLDKKPELMFKTAGRVREALNIIENEAVRQLRMPSELQSLVVKNGGQMDNKSLYKPVFGGDYMYAKLHRDCSFFNSRREMIKKNDLGYGDYRVVCVIRGLYIGSQNGDSVMASLHVRIFQIQYREVNVTCLFENAAGMLSNMSGGMVTNSSSPPETPTISPLAQPQPQPSTSSRKNSRKGAKPALPRQNNGPVEAMQHVPTEALPQDFYEDFNI